MKISYKNWKCPRCELIFDTRRLMEIHRKETHKQFSNGRDWAKGLTAKTDERLAKRLAHYNENEAKGLHLNKPKTCFQFLLKFVRKFLKSKKKIIVENQDMLLLEKAENLMLNNILIRYLLIVNVITM